MALNRGGPVADPWASIHERDKRDYIFKICESKEELADWVLTYTDIDFTSEGTDPASNSGPLDAMWQIYEAVRDNKGDEIPGFILLSSRDSYKTLCASILELLLLLHFRVTIAHMAAIQSQSSKAIRYINVVINKVKKYIEYHGWKNISSSKSMIQFRTPEGDEPYITVIICTMTGANSEHTNLMFVDEIDVVRDPLAYEESKMIPGVHQGRFPITVKLSTRKFAFGLMQKELENAPNTGEKVLSWNLLDVTEKCQPKRHSPSAMVKDKKTGELRYDPKKQQKIKRMIARDLPLRQISPEDFETVPTNEKADWEEAIAHEGCLKCPLFPICKGNLAKKSDAAVGGLYKPIQHTINQFRKVSPDTATAQLLCRKPSTKGLIYARVELDMKKDQARRNVLTIEEAYFSLMGTELPVKKGMSQEDKMDVLRLTILQLELDVYAGLDWGYRHEFSIVVGAHIPNGEFWILESFGLPGLELEDQKRYGLELYEKWGIRAYYPDNAYPGSITTFRRAGMRMTDFKKEVMTGIEGVRGMIVDANNVRRLKVIEWEKNVKIKQMFKNHHFKLDLAGNVTEEPDDEEFADTGDATRYLGQNRFSAKKGRKPIISSSGEPKRADPNQVHEDGARLREEIRRRSGQVSAPVGAPKPPSKKRKIFWNL